MLQSSDKNLFLQDLKTLGEQHYKSQQLAKRMSELLPRHLISIEQEYRNQHSPAKSKRLALQDSRYLDEVKKLNEIKNTALRSKMQWEAGLMKFKAMQSIQAYKRIWLRYRASC